MAISYLGLIANTDPLVRITLFALDMATPFELAPARTRPLVVHQIVASAAAH